jgi:hypothetical protein
MPDQNNSDDNAAPETATQKLAALVARKKLVASGGPASKGAQLQAERQAAARATSKSKPALRKG